MTPSPPPAVIERRQQWSWFATAGIIVAAVFALPLLVLPLWAATIPFTVSLLAVYGVLLSVTGRTTIGTDGIHDRQLWERHHLRWTSITEVVLPERKPRTISVVLEDGRTLPLAGIRDTDRAPDGLTHERLADEIRRRAGLRDVSPEPAYRVSSDLLKTPWSPPPPVALRPPARPGGRIVALMAALTVLGLASAAFGSLGLAAYFGHLLFYPIVVLMCWASGRTEAGPHGVLNRWLGSAEMYAWQDVSRVAVQTTLFGRCAVLVLASGEEVALAAPREGLLSRDPHFRSTVERLAEAHPAPYARHRGILTDGPPILERPLLYILTLAPLAAALLLDQPWNAVQG